MRNLQLSSTIVLVYPCALAQIPLQELGGAKFLSLTSVLWLAEPRVSLLLLKFFQSGAHKGQVKLVWMQNNFKSVKSFCWNSGVERKVVLQAVSPRTVLLCVMAKGKWHLRITSHLGWKRPSRSPSPANRWPDLLNPTIKPGPLAPYPHISSIPAGVGIPPAPSAHHLSGKEFLLMSNLNLQQCSCLLTQLQQNSEDV